MIDKLISVRGSGDVVNHQGFGNVLNLDGMMDNLSRSQLNYAGQTHNPYSLLSPSSSFSFSFLIRQRSNTAYSTVFECFNSLTASPANDTNYLFLTATGIGFVSRSGGVNFERQKFFENQLRTGWNHVVITYDNGNVRYYVNGYENKVVTYNSIVASSPTLYNYSSAAFIGKYWDINGERFNNCDLAEVACFYNYVLSETEVRRINNKLTNKAGTNYSEIYGSAYSNVLFHLPMNQAPSSIFQATDFSTNNNHFTIHNQNPTQFYAF